MIVIVFWGDLAGLRTDCGFGATEQFDKVEFVALDAQFPSA